MAKEIAQRKISIGKKIGSGSFGAVSSALVTGDSRNFVVKSPAGDGDYSDILYECEVLRKLGYNEGITSLIYYYNTGKRIGLLFEQGLCSLANLAKNASFSEEEIRGVYIDIRRALAFTHHEGYVHLDVKPDNIILFADGSIKLADFGLATELNQDCEYKNVCAGTLAYMAPSVLQGDEYASYTVDFWALAVTCLELFFGYVPFAGTTPQRILRNIGDRRFFGHSRRKINWQQSETGIYFLSKLTLDEPTRHANISYLEDPYFYKSSSKLKLLVKSYVKSQKRKSKPSVSQLLVKRRRI